MKQRILNHFGIEQLGTFSSNVSRLFQTDIKSAILDNQMVALAGDVGVGKSVMFNQVIAQLSRNSDSSPLFCQVRNFNKENLSIMGIISEVITDLSNEHPRRDTGARSRQFVRLVGGKFVNEKRHVCIIIEEAHRLHYNTLRSLKELRESEFAGISPLFSVVLIGHPELAMKLERRKEVYWRSHLIQLNEASGWMTLAERLRYVAVRFGEAITQEARERIAALVKVPLEIDVFVGKRLEEAYHAGITQLGADAIQLSALELKDAYGLSLKQIADEAGLGKTTVQNAIYGQTKPETTDRVKDAIERLGKSTHNRQAM